MWALTPFSSENSRCFGGTYMALRNVGFLGRGEPQTFQSTISPLSPRSKGNASKKPEADGNPRKRRHGPMKRRVSLL
jgi:hypothetical protein